MAKPIGPSCNLECTYCYYLDTAHLYPEQSDFRMTDDTLETYIKQYIEANPGPDVPFAWQGGEPTLLGVEFFHKVLEYQDAHAPAGTRIHNSIQTNGTRLDDEWGRFLAENNFLVGISIDGPRELHNTFRHTRSGAGTFDAVMDGLATLQAHDVEHNVLCVLNAINSHHPLEVYHFFNNQGLEWMQFIPLVEPLETSEPNTDERATPGSDDPPTYPIPPWVTERDGDVERVDPTYHETLRRARTCPVTDRSVDPEVYGEFMCTILDEWVRNDIGEVSVRLFDQCLEQLLTGQPSLCVFAETCGRALAIEHNGDVFSCDHYVEPAFHRGTIHDAHLATLVDTPEQRHFGEAKRETLPDRCRTCDVRDICNGGCPKHRLASTPSGEAGLNYLCAGYRRVFTYAQPYLGVIEETLADGLGLAYAADAVETLDEMATS